MDGRQRHEIRRVLGLLACYVEGWEDVPVEVRCALDLLTVAAFPNWRPRPPEPTLEPSDAYARNVPEP